MALVPSEYEDFWSQGEREYPLLRRENFLEAFAFGDSEPMANALATLVLQGTKRATASLAWRYETGETPQPKPGDLSIVTNWGKEPLCIIETTAVDLVPFNEVSEAFARVEGEDDGTLESWRRNHTKFFAGECERLGRTPSEDMLVVCECFSVVYRATDA
jgi:uncharacterized protein YhfF